MGIEVLLVSDVPLYRDGIARTLDGTRELRRRAEAAVLVLADAKPSSDDDEDSLETAAS